MKLKQEIKNLLNSKGLFSDHVQDHSEEGFVIIRKYYFFSTTAKTWVENVVALLIENGYSVTTKRVDRTHPKQSYFEITVR